MKLRLMYWIPTLMIAVVMTGGGLVDLLRTDLRVFPTWVTPTTSRPSWERFSWSGSPRSSALA